MRVEDCHEKEHKEDAVELELLNGVMIEKDVTVDLREAQDDIQNLQVALVLKVLISVILALRLYSHKYM